MTHAARIHWLLSDTLVFARRNLAHVLQIPEKLIDVTLQPLMFTLLFAFVFGGVIHVPGGNYREYVVAGILVQTIAFGIAGPGTSIATDLGEGIVDRFRSLPTSRSAFLLGHLLSEMVAALIAIAVLVAAGVVVGWGVHASVASAIAGFAVLVLFAAGMIWLGTLIGVSVRSPDAVMGIAFLIIFPLTFLSNAFVPAGGLPDGLLQIAEWNPISVVVSAMRTLFGNATATPAGAPWPLQHPVLGALLWCLAILAVTVPLTLWRYRAKTAG